MSIKNIKFIIFILALLLIGLFFSNELKPIQNFFYNLIRPISRSFVSSSSKIGDFFSNIKSINRILKDNSTLTSENKNLSSKLASLKEVAHENQVLKKQLSYSDTQKDLKLIPARVIGYSPTDTFQVLTLDKGTKDGVQVGKAIISEGYLVGVVKDVTSNNSDILLINSSRSLVPVVLQDSRASGLLRGGLDGLTVENLPLDIAFKKDETVITSGLGGQLPPGIIVGKISDIVSTKSEIFQRARVTSPVEFSRLEYLFIVK